MLAQERSAPVAVGPMVLIHGQLASCVLLQLRGEHIRHSASFHQPKLAAQGVTGCLCRLHSCTDVPAKASSTRQTLGTPPTLRSAHPRAAVGV
eukprot:363740-Chlamydomonas_euryale.AAC.27